MEYQAKDGSTSGTSKLKIECIKNDKTLIELQNKLKLSSSDDCSRLLDPTSKIRILMSDYSRGTGDKNVKVHANITPEECEQWFDDAKTLSMFGSKAPYVRNWTKIFGMIKDENGNPTGRSYVTKLMIVRNDTDQQGEKRRYPWCVTIENGSGIMSEKGNMLTPNTYICDRKVVKFLSDVDILKLLRRASALIRSVENLSAFANQQDILN